MKFNTREKLLLLAPLVFLLLFAIGRGSGINEYWQRLNPYGDVEDKIALRLAGWGATICGHVANAAISSNRAATDACAVASFRAKRPFVARYNTKTDSWWIIGTPEGPIRYIHHPRPGSVFFTKLVCRRPVIVTVHGRERLQCSIPLSRIVVDLSR